MKLETFFEKFDLFADAPDAVEKMRELILDLAIGGRLLRTSDSAEREAQGGWPKQTLGSIASLITKESTPTSYGHQYEASGIPFVKVENIANGVINRSSMEQFISEPTHEFLKRSQLESGDILFSIAGTIGKTCVVSSGDVPANTNQALAIIRGFNASFEIPFLKMQLDSFVANKVKAKARGGAMPNVSLGDLRDLLVVVPSLAEQKRIVAKVDELMALCDRLETQQQERETRHAALARASLARFDDAPVPANLTFLFHPSYTIPPADLRKSILTLAVQGKLVSQDPDDEPAEEGSHGKKGKVIETVAEKEMPFPIPRNWTWGRLGNIGIGSTGKTPPTRDPENYGGEIPFIGPGQITPSGTFLPSDKFLSEEGLESGVEALPGDVLMVCIGGSIGKSAISRERISFNQQINAVRPISLTSEFTYFAFTSFYFQEEVAKRATGSATPIINRGKWEEIPIPIPPLAEQRRIVAKVGQLMTLVDQLETQLAASRATGANLVDAMVSEVVVAA